MCQEDRETPVRPGWARFLVLLVAAVAGLGGVVLESRLFRKLFVECFPYKIMDVPPASFFAAIGEHASLAFVLLGCVAVILLGRRAAHMIPLVLTVAAPFLVLVILVIGALWYGPSPSYCPDCDRGAAIETFTIFGCGPSALIALGASIVTLLLRPRRPRRVP